MVTFDTLKASHRLRDAGFEEKQADALVNAFAQDIGANLATKDDIALLLKDMANGFVAVRQEMTSEIAAVRQEMTSEIAAVRQEMASGDEAIRKDMASGFAAVRQEMASQAESIRKDMALQEERMNARFERQTARMIQLAVGMTGLLLAAIGIATGIIVSRL